MKFIHLMRFKELVGVGENLLLSLGYIIVFCKIEHFLSLDTI